MPFLLALLAVGAPIAVQVEEVGELDQARALELARSIGAAIETRTSSTVRTEDPAWWGCSELGHERCLDELRARSGAEDVVMLRLYGSVRAIRVVAERYAPRQYAPSSGATIDFPRTSTAAQAALDRLASTLYAEVAAPKVSHRAPPPAPRFGPWPWVAVGAGVVAVAVGTGFAISSLGAKSQLESQTRSHEEYEDLSGRMDLHGAVAGALFVGAGVAVIVAVTLWMLDDGVDVPAEGVDRASHGPSLFVP